MDPTVAFNCLLDSLVSLNTHIATVVTNPAEAPTRRAAIRSEYASLAESRRDLADWLGRGGFLPSIGDKPATAEQVERALGAAAKALREADRVCGEVYGSEPMRLPGVPT